MDELTKDFVIIQIYKKIPNREIVRDKFQSYPHKYRNLMQNNNLYNKFNTIKPIFYYFI